MKESLEAKGWVMYHECNTCQGHKQFFKNNDKPDYEVRVRLKSKTFSILQKNMVIGGPFWEYMLDEKLNQYVK